jgi:cobalt-zinc-cadmium efflux system membrane fusion protein
VQGKVSGINIYPGVQVKKGTVLCYLTHPDILQMQQQYVKARANADLSASELKRQTNLSNEEATSKRKVQMADADFVNNDAEMHALEGKLKLLGIDVNSVKAGNFVSKIPVVASIAGFVKEVLVNEGKTVAANDVLFTIINTDHLHLELKVFERDSYKIKDGQKISFSVRSEPNKFYDAEIYVAAKNLDAANGTVSIHGHFHEEGVNLMPGSYVDAKIKVGNSARATLPEGAILHLGNRHLVFVAKTSGDTVSFEKVDIKVGRIISGYAEILDAKDWENQSIVVANPDFLEAQLNNSEEE